MGETLNRLQGANMGDSNRAGQTLNRLQMANVAKRDFEAARRCGYFYVLQSRA